MHDWGWNHDGMFVMWIIWIPIVIVLVWFLIKLRNAASNKRTEKNIDTPLDLLKKRYAKGEIDTEEYEKRKNKLQE